jgi:lysophospholipase
MNAVADLQPVATLVDVPSNPVPKGAVSGLFETPDKVKLRYATFPKGAGAARGTVCLVQGRTEFIEKYFETISDLQSRGFAVATFDWRGQGGSQRLVEDPLLGYVDTFDDYWTDLKTFHGSVLLPDCPPPYYLVGHSMGGLVSLMAAARDRMMFERVFLTAPMLSIYRQPMSLGSMATIAELLAFLGLGQMAAGGNAHKPPTEGRFGGNPLTSDPVRYMRMVDVLKARPELTVGPPSIRWGAAAYRAMARAALDEFPGSIKIPVLMLAAARDQIVSTAAIEQLGLRLRTGRHAVIATARHELFMENDDIRGQVFAAFDAFITEQST